MTRRVPTVLTIAGSDSGGGAGIQADIKTFQELDVYGMSAITAVTVQNTLGVNRVYPLAPEAAAEQVRAVGEDLGVDALKTGMLFSAPIIRAIATEIRRFGWEKVVVDPVMIAKGGQELLQQEAVLAMKEELLPLAMAVTPNIPEAEVLAGMPILTMMDRREAAKRIATMGPKLVVIKGGHAGEKDGNESEEVIDLLYDGHTFTELGGKRINTRHTHGTGCTFSAALTSCLAKGIPVFEAVRTARNFIQAAIEDGLALGHGHGPTNHWAYRRRQELSWVGSGSAGRSWDERVSPTNMREFLRMYLVIGSMNCGSKEPLQVVEEALAGGATLVQFREKGLGALAGAAREALALELQAACRRAGVPFIINDDVDLALKIGADGVHIGQDDEDAGMVRKRIGNRLLGVSAHNASEAQLAAAMGADYLGIGPIYPTASKADAHAVQGPDILCELRGKDIMLPMVGIGGITIARAAEVVQAGADGVAVISAVTALPVGEIRAAVGQLKQLVFNALVSSD